MSDDDSYTSRPWVYTQCFELSEFLVPNTWVAIGHDIDRIEMEDFVVIGQDSERFLFEGGKHSMN